MAGLPLTCNKTSHNRHIEPGMVSFEGYASSLMGKRKKKERKKRKEIKTRATAPQIRR